jgi:CHAT domain-containing protein
LAAAEPEVIRRYLHVHGIKVNELVRSAATKAAVLEAAVSADILHVGAHGRTDLIDPGRSALWLHDPAAERSLQGGDDPFSGLAAHIDKWREPWPGMREVVIRGAGMLSERDNGDGVVERVLEHPLGSTRWIRYAPAGPRVAELWTADEIAVGQSLPRCRLALLTACEAGGGGYAQVDEAAGLPAALIAAGVPTVIASLWPVADDVALIFTDLFYRKFSDALAEIGFGVGAVDLADLLRDLRAEMQSMTSAYVATALGSLIDMTTDARARARLRAARSRRAAEADRPFAEPIDWAAFSVFGEGVMTVGMPTEDADIK